MLMSKSRAWAEIDLSRIAHNVEEVRALIPATSKIMGIVKADAYGHGAVECTRALEACGVDFFGVSSVDEAVELREHGIRSEILILGYTPPQHFGLLAAHDLIQTLVDLSYAQKLDAFAAEANVTIRAHAKADTGMNRIGVRWDEVVEFARQISFHRALDLVGTFTHFATADCPGTIDFERQVKRFSEAVNALRAAGINPGIVHAANSAAAIRYPEVQLDMVRPGIILYGMEPSDSVQHPLDLRPAMELKTVISQKKCHSRRGNGQLWPHLYRRKGNHHCHGSQSAMQMDIPGNFPGKAEMLVHGKRAPIVGRVCMDQLMLDVTHIPDVEEGDVVTVFGRDGGAFLPVEEVSSLDQTINYETVCQITKRVPRIYRGGKLGGIEKAGRLAR